MTSKPDWIVLARFLRPQGRKGEVLAELLTDFPAQLTERRGLFLAPPQFNGEPETLRAAEITSFWLPKGKNEGRVVLEVGGVTSIEDAELLAGLDVITSREQRLPLGDDEIYISDLIGCQVFDRGVALGSVTDVQFATTPDGRRRLTDAAPLLAVSPSDSLPDAEDLLLPFVKAFLVSINLEQRRLEMHLPEGLLELNVGSGSDPVGEI